MAEMQDVIYGTAWKGENTSELVRTALQAGFRRFDTAAQRRHYREDLVGDGVRQFLLESGCLREEIWLQTKFTPMTSQDEDGILPYDKSARLSEQVESSIEMSLLNLRPRADFSSQNESYIDSYLLHVPLESLQETLIVWTTMQRFVPHRIKQIGISNITPPILQVLQRAKAVTIKPKIVQNPSHNDQSSNLMEICRTSGVSFQVFGVLKHNQVLLTSKCVTKAREILGCSAEAALIGLMARLEGVEVLVGTTNERRMIEILRTMSQLRDEGEECTLREVQAEFQQHFNNEEYK